MCSAVLESGRTADTHEFCFQAAEISDMVCVELHWCLFPDCQVCYFRSPKFQIIAVPFFKRVDLLMITNIGFRVRNVEICAVQSSKEFYLPMTRIAFSGSEKIKNVQCRLERI